MRRNVSFLLIVPVCLLAFMCFAQAQEIHGTITDPSGAVISGASLRLTAGDMLIATATTDQKGNYSIRAQRACSPCQLSVSAEGFAAISREVRLSATETLALAIHMEIGTVSESVSVEAKGYPTLATTQQEVSASEKVHSLNAAELLSDLPGVGLRQSGELATIPLLHGLGDERTRLLVDGVTVSNACANHMNPPLSYIAPSSATEVTVIAGITPVSMGGDSLGGTISLNSPLPVFADENEGWRSEGTLSSFVQSNGENYGPALSGWVANHNFGIGYSGSWVNAGDYTDGSGHKVTSTYAQSTDHLVTLAAQGSGNLFVLQAGLHHMPYQGFPNAQMDMVRNFAETLNFRYKRNFAWGVLDARTFWQGTWHSMNIGEDKSTFPMPMWMPMNTHGKDYGYTVKLDVPFAERHTLHVGSELHRFVLADGWPAVPGTEPYMGPNPFISINNGRRTRLAWFGEVASKWGAKWSTLLGIRNDMVRMNTGQVSGYSDMYAADADAFNAVSHARTDVNFDATALARYEPNRSVTFEFGYARKTRSPNLYERYAWSTNWMASGMVGWFGDGNYYVGNLNLKPEVGHTVSASVSWHDPARKQWEVKLTPYQTYVQNYIDVDALATATYGASTFAQLQFANHDARIYGLDASGKAAIWNDAKFGRGEFSGVVGYLHGERLNGGSGLYQMMPLNARLAFDEKLKGWSGGIQVQAVNRKSNVDPRRFEQPTPGYTLVGVRTAYQLGYIRFDLGCDNLFNKYYELPLGGVNFDDYMASGWMSQIRPLTGRGRSVYVGLTMQLGSGRNQRQ